MRCPRCKVELSPSDSDLYPDDWWCPLCGRRYYGSTFQVITEKEHEVDRLKANYSDAGTEQ